MSYGPCSGTATAVQFAESRDRELAHFIDTFSPFSLKTPAGSVTVAGRGRTAATPAEQRAAAEWARLIVQEAAGDRSSAAAGLAFSWHREGGIAGFCDDLAAYVPGAYRRSSCKPGAPNIALGWLSATQLQQMYTLLDRLGRFEVNQTDPAKADALTQRLVFNGNGTAQPSDADRQAVLDLANQIYAGKTQ